MPLFAFEGREPKVSPAAWIAPTATLVAAGATVPPGLTIPDGMLAVGVPARVAGEVSGGASQWVETNPEVYRELGRATPRVPGPSPARRRPGDARDGRRAAWYSTSTNMRSRTRRAERTTRRMPPV